MKSFVPGALCAMLALGIAACDRDDSAINIAGANASAPLQQDDNIVEVLDDADGLGTAHALVETAGLETVLSGVGPYTLFAPTDDAFAALGEDKVNAMKGDGMKAEDAALLRAHLVPGLLTRADIADAITKGGGSARMTTMAGGTLTFTQSGEAIIVTADDGAKAMLTGDESIASNGSIEPVSAPLVISGSATDT